MLFLSGDQMPPPPPPPCCGGRSAVGAAQWSPSPNQMTPVANPYANSPGMNADIANAFLTLASVAATGAAVYHGYKRNGKVNLGWVAGGLFFPFIAVVVALAQGFGKPAEK